MGKTFTFFSLTPYAVEFAVQRHYVGLNTTQRTLNTELSLNQTHVVVCSAPNQTTYLIRGCLIEELPD
jgi:hypothetical protein